MKRELAASRVAIGHCVIINDCDRPYGRCVAVVTAVSLDGVTAEYLATSVNMAECSNRKFQHVTPINSFGVRVFVDGNKFHCSSEGSFSAARYPDGGVRHWQESGPVKYDAKPLVLAKAKTANSTPNKETDTPNQTAGGGK